MCELLDQCEVSNEDLQRMQFALGKSGLSNFEIVDNRLMVPKSEHATYLTAVAEQNAAPGNMRDEDKDAPAVNPFLTRTQQLAIAQNQKKRQIKEMVVRLPFVEQAWFEMDKSDSRSAFQRAQQSAVISIQPLSNTSLTDAHVDTVKRMIGGAIAGLNLSEIVVIDLSEGWAHQDSTDPLATQQIRTQRVELEERRTYENRIREALKDYPGIEVTVQVDFNPMAAKNNHLVSQSVVPNVHPSQLPSATYAPVAGANGVISLDGFKSERPNLTAPPTPIALTTNPNPNQRVQKEISVLIAVPQKLVHDIFGEPIVNRVGTLNPSDYQAALAKDTQFKFNQLESEIVKRVLPLLPKLDQVDEINHPAIAVNLIRDQSTETAATWPAQLKTLISKNWPSVAVLAIGLILLSIVSRNTDTAPSGTGTEPNASSSNLNQRDERPASNASDANDPDVRLSKLIEKDPNAAARVIESWIRDAA